MPETESLWHLSQSKAHRHLLKHPVVQSFLWLKWQRIRGYFNRNLRFYLMFVACLSWYIFERFGGVSSRMTETRQPEPNETLSVDRGDHFYCSDLSERYERGFGFWYFAFAAHCLVQISLMLRDWRHDCCCCTSDGYGSTKRSLFQLCTTGWLELILLAMMGGLLFFSTKGLWLSLTILLGLLVIREFFQMSGSLKRYFLSPENLLEVSMIVLVGVILWVPDGSLGWGPCAVKRHLAAVAIILSWAELITLVARHPRLARYRLTLCRESAS